MRRFTRAILFATAALLGPMSVMAQDRGGVPVPVTGRTLDVVLADGERLSGELIEADSTRVLLWGPSGLRALDYTSLARVEAQRHGFGSKQALTWIGIGALATATGMTIACSQLEDTSCGQVFVGFTLSWVLIGGLFAATVVPGQYQEVPAGQATLRPLARFPQGAPASFVEANRAVARPPR